MPHRAERLAVRHFLLVSALPAAVPGAPPDTITVKYKILNDGAIAKRIAHQVTYTNGASHTASGVSSR